MTTNEGKKLIKEVLNSLGLSNKLTARREYNSLARAEKIVVTVHDWTPNPLASKIKEAAPKGIIVIFKGSRFIQS